ncbi:hypothetical protein LTR74_000567 [Friedmanniomyces endolithicus]|nr:hypothetical protein LTR74_000567 [Friedmanniomyces endolithicus]
MAKKASHAEIWDDSALVTSWNEALAEYKKYHSLAARGEKIEVILDEAENRDGELDASEDAVPGGDLPVHQAPGPSGVTTNGISAATITPPAANQTVPAAAASAAAVPQLLLNQGKHPATISPSSQPQLCIYINALTGFRSSRRTPKKRHDELVLRRLLHGTLRRTAEDFCWDPAAGALREGPSAPHLTLLKVY